MRRPLLPSLRPWLLNWLPWLAYFAFIAVIIPLHWHDNTLNFDRPLAPLKATVWLTWLAFVAYSLYCTRRENFWRTLRTMAGLHWGRQIGIDLYLGAAITLTLICLHEGTALALLIWLIPVFCFVNLATLLYLALHFDAIIARFIS